MAVASPWRSSRFSPWIDSAAFGGTDHRRRGRGGPHGVLPGQGVGSTALRGAEMRSVGVAAHRRAARAVVTGVFSLDSSAAFGEADHGGRHRGQGRVHSASWGRTSKRGSGGAVLRCVAALVRTRAVLT